MIKVTLVTPLVICNCSSIRLWPLRCLEFLKREVHYVGDIVGVLISVTRVDKSTCDCQTEQVQSYSSVSLGNDPTINEIVYSIVKAIGDALKSSPDPIKPDGASRNWISSDRLQKLGWSAEVGLVQGLEKVHHDFIGA